MKRKFLSILLTLAMALTLLPTAAMAEETDGVECSDANCSHVVAVRNDGGNGTLLHYNSLNAAISQSIPVSEMTLLRDIQEDVIVSQHHDIYLNLNGHNITNKSSDTITVEKGGTLSISGSGTVDNVTNGKAAIYNNGRVTLSGGSYTRSAEAENDIEHSGGNSYYNILNHGEMTIEDGVSVTSSGHFSSLVANGYYNYTATDKGERTAYISNIGNAAPELTISGGTFSGGINTVKNDDNAKLVISGGSFSNVTQAVVQNNNVAEIHGGTFNAADHHAVENRHYNSNYNVGSVTITDGNFTGALYMTDGATWNITGGTFTADPTAYLADGYKFEMVGSTFSVVPNSDAVAQNGEKTFVSLQNAINDAKNGDTITLLKDVDLGNTVTVANKTVTLDMAGKTIYNTKDLWDSEPNAWSLISVRENGNLTITGDGTLKAKADDCYALDTQEGSAKLTVENGTVIGNVTAVYIYQGEVNIQGGNYSIQQLNSNGVQGPYDVTINCYDGNYKNKTAKVTVTGGYFAYFNPANTKAEGAGTNFVTDGYVSVTSDKSGYDYKVVQKTDTGSIVVKPAVAEPEVNVDKISESDRAKVENAAKSVEVPTLGAAAGDKVAAMNKTDAERLVAKAQGMDNPTLYVQTALKVEPTAYSAENKTLTLDITPQYRIVASTADKADDIRLSGSSKNAQVVQDYQKLTITAPTVVTMELPTGFANDGDKLSIKHTKDNGTVEYYTGKVTADGGKLYLTFTTNGFSPFVISSAVASIDGEMYPTLAEAVANVDSGKTIKLETDCAEAVTVSRTVAFTLDANGHTHTGKIVSGSYTVEANAAVTSVAGYTGAFAFAYTAPSHSSSGGSSSSSRRYDVSAPSVKHGDVTVSPKTASKGDTVTITVKPDSGYELDTLTVKDASGSKIKVKDKGDGKFTFTMPASKVTVSAEFAEIETLDFADVSTDAYYYEAVKWAAKKGITGGTGDGTFNPNGSCTRAHIVTFLWRAAGSPEPKSTVSFADVPADSYYAKAVAWAVENGITLGTGDGTFSPNATCTRAQSVTFLYRALGTAPTTVNGFTDVTADAFYADAVAWAVESGVTNGTSASTFSPNNGCTRAQIVTFLYRTMK